MSKMGVETGRRELKVYFLNLVLVSAVRVFDVVFQGLWARKVVVGRRRGDNVPVAGDLARESGDGAGDCGMVRCWGDA